MKTIKKLTASVLAVASADAMTATMAPAFAHAEEAVSGTFNEIFHWSYVNETLAFTVDSSVESEDAPWDIYFTQVKHIIIDDKISFVGTDIFVNYDRKNAALETITCGEKCMWDIGLCLPNWYRAHNITLRAPMYSNTDYYAFQNGINFESTGTAENPYLHLSNESNTWQYLENDSLMKVSNTDNENQWLIASRWYGRYKNILISEKCVATEEPSLFDSRVISGVTQDVYDALYHPTLYCYPEYEFIEYMRENETSPVVVLGEPNSERKGDANLDGSVNINDATIVLGYYAQIAAGMEASFTNDEELNKFAYYLADVDTESISGKNTETEQIDISDATNILTYYAQTAAGLNPDWGDILYQ